MSRPLTVEEFRFVREALDGRHTHECENVAAFTRGCSCGLAERLAEASRIVARASEEGEKGDERSSAL
jgi:hypothetical protein